ncbi:response regulator transcription factor [Velocimicrobium porci]|uniref:Stage 0 sporulation protein A homolog n=1 Tax=Velocimicrobium porci TaxID=2606634 RepID=A0A6L5XXC6_9FIRM|nr:response regulator [Velocimicrobium porci]MSS63402.1 response regulator [Velocimicrobium porci]
MYKVMIIDDEPIIVEGISRMVPWDKYNCKVIATAHDGIEGAELIREHKPNIIFSDIAMPGLDGLTMIAGLKSEFPDMMICILTGYRDFDYAQQAIRLGVTRFLLKPSNMDEIEEAIQVMTERLKKKSVDLVATEEGGDELTATIDEDSSASSFIVKNAMKFIEENYKKKLTLSEVAEKTYVSQWHLSKLLNKHTGKSFSELLNSVRISKAKELLSDSSLRIGDIAEAVGFVDLAHFSRVFKKIMGISANEYRNRIAKDDIH